MFRFLILVSLLLFCLSCRKDQPVPEKYLFLGHIYQWGVPDNNRIDYRFEGFDFEAWDQIWLGGDLCARTTEFPETLEYLDSIFALDSPYTHWALGNHDINHGHLEWITATTGRNSFYTASFDNICLVVLNTTEFYHPDYRPKAHECQLLDQQLSMLESLADTIRTASHCIVLHHNALLNNDIARDSVEVGKTFNFYRPELKVSCKHPDIFQKVIFPVLKRIQTKGIQVIMVGGDLGQRTKEFEFRSEEGIVFLGSGINNSALAFHLPDYVTNTSPDKVLIFQNHPKEKLLSWEFVELNDLVHKKSSKE